jgi:pSer/pThr/pTyr-binding forkhead associated (FHA) protein
VASPAGAGGATRIGAGALLRSAAAGEAFRAGPHLLVREPRAEERVVPLTGDCTVGRGRAADLRLADPSASRLHLRLRLDEGGASAEDLGSHNGLRVNGARTRGARRLRSGDRLEVGATVLRYLDPLEPAGTGASGPGAAPGRASAAGLAALACALLALAAAALAGG